MEYPEELCEKFKQDYYSHGKYDLDMQVTHLYRLAEFYQEKYKVTKDWTDCIKAHALYNSVGARRPEYIGWKERVFDIQQLYWGGKSSLSFDQQEKLTASLKCELESIREQSRDEMSEADELVEVYEDLDTAEKDQTRFYECMRRVSLSCSENMAKFAGGIISESVAMISSHKPPCDFVTVAIGSLARGEATPYSDLEYLFLVADKSQETLEYYESLAITSYFQITNLGETKLSYMAIKELEGWFQDCSINGFKIDGLSAKAGNIPTGNGKPSQRNHFIVSPQELADRYRTVLNNPTKEEATRGDLTAMLTYMKPIYSHQTTGNDLLREIQSNIQYMVLQKKRMLMNMNMLIADIQKFDFRPNLSPDAQAFTADVKRDFYRFPSIVLYDITVITRTFTPSSWESLDKCHNKGLLSAELYHLLHFLLASASYMRLSAYLYHNSQDERISIAPTTVKHKKMPATQSKLKISRRRWFVPQGIFISICSKTLLIKNSIAQALEITFEGTEKQDGDEACSAESQLYYSRMVALSYLVTSELNAKWSQIVALLYSGRNELSFIRVKQIYGESICETPVAVIHKIPVGVSLLERLSNVSSILFTNGEDTAALQILKHISDRKLCEIRVPLALCYRQLGEYGQALNILESLKEIEPLSALPELGVLHYKMKEYGKSEEVYLHALDLEHDRLIFNDYEGNHIKSDIPNANNPMRLRNVGAPGERLSMITHISPVVIVCVVALGAIYRRIGLYSIAEAYLLKSKEFILEIYGEDAATDYIAQVLTALGHLYHTTGDNYKAINYYKQASCIYRIITEGKSLNYSQALYGLGESYLATGNHKGAYKNYKMALAVRRKLPKGVNDGHIAIILCGLGGYYAERKQFSEAIDHYDQSLAIFRQPPVGPESIEAAKVLSAMGMMYCDIEMYRKAEECFKEALFIYRGQTPGYHNKKVAQILFMIARAYSNMHRLGEADDYCEQALSVYRIIHGNADSLDIASVLALKGADVYCDPLARYMFKR